MKWKERNEENEDATEMELKTNQREMNNKTMTKVKAISKKTKRNHKQKGAHEKE
jgi:hypothetical protein